MRLKYETGIATLIQFLILTLLAIPNAIISIITTCHKHSLNCSTNALASAAFFVLTGVWFGSIWIIGYFAQEKRSRLLAWLLIGAEGFTSAVVLIINIKHESNYLKFLTSLLDVGLAIWISLLAFRLIRSKGGRIVGSERSRHRRIHDNSNL